MQVVILCGGKGTRLSEETKKIPKPMVKIGGKPILSHIMGIYSRQMHSEFLLATGYRGDKIRARFCHGVKTGLNTMTGGRLLRLKNDLNGTFMLTYGDGLCDVNLKDLLTFHKAHGKLCTVTAVRPIERFGKLHIHGNQVAQFGEKFRSKEEWVNGGFFVMEPGIFKYLKDDSTILELDPMSRLAQDGQLMAFKHEGFWQCMDTLRDKELLQKLWKTGRAPWVQKGMSDS